MNGLIMHAQTLFKNYLIMSPTLIIFHGSYNPSCGVNYSWFIIIIHNAVNKKNNELTSN